MLPKKEGAFINRQVQKTIGIKLNNLSKLATRAEKDASNKTADHLQTAVNNLRDTAQKTRTINGKQTNLLSGSCLLYTSPSPRDRQKSRMPSSA